MVADRDGARKPTPVLNDPFSCNAKNTVPSDKLQRQAIIDECPFEALARY